jgi:hypothetical protein
MNQSVTMKYLTMRSTLIGLFVAGLLVVASGCDGLFDVKNPGTIQDVDLNNPDALRAVVTGMSSDLSAELDAIAFVGARLSDEMAASGSYFISTRARFGFIDSEDVDAYWEGIQRARFSAEDGLRRMRGVLGENYDGQEDLAARAYLLAGLSNRVLAENFVKVTFNGGSTQERTAAFARGDSLLQLAVQWADQSGSSEIEMAAIGARAQMQAGLGNWDQARDLAAQVPTDFVYNAPFSNNSGREQNEVFDETHQRFEMSAFGTIVADLGPEEDPRVPYTDCRNANPECSAEIGADGQTFHLRQEKYPDLGADIPLVKGTEMRLIEAEAALVLDGDANAAMASINEVRAFHDLDDLSAPNGVGQTGENGFQPGTAWYHLGQERLLTLWLEGRRLNDLYRWDHPFKYGPGEVDIVYEQGPTIRAVILPVAESECNNNENVPSSECAVTYTQ